MTDRALTHEPLRALLSAWKSRADSQNLPATSKQRDAGCLDFFCGAATLAEDLYGIQHPLAVRLIKICIYIIATRGEKGVTDHIAGLVPVQRGYRWEPMTYTPNKGQHCDVEGGRLLVQRAREGSHSFLAYWNGKKLEGQALPQSMSEAKLLAEATHARGDCKPMEKK